MSNEGSEMSIPVESPKSPELTYQEARGTLIGVRRELDDMLESGSISRYTLVLSGSAAYEFRQPTDLDCFLIYKKGNPHSADLRDKDVAIDDYLYERKSTDTHFENTQEGEVLEDIKEMLEKGLSGHRRIELNGIEVDLQVSQERIFLRQLNETLDHARNRLLRRDFFYMACDRDDVPDSLRRAVWFVSPLLAVADSRVAVDLQEMAVSRYQKLVESLGTNDENVDSLDEILGKSFKEYLESLGYLEGEEIALAVDSVKSAFKGEDTLDNKKLQNILGKLVRGIVLEEELPYTFSKSFRAKLSNYWNGQNFITHGISAGAVMIAGSQIINEDSPVFEKVDVDFLAD